MKKMIAQIKWKSYFYRFSKLEILKIATKQKTWKNLQKIFLGNILRKYWNSWNIPWENPLEISPGNIPCKYPLGKSPVNIPWNYPLEISFGNIFRKYPSEILNSWKTPMKVHPSWRSATPVPISIAKLMIIYQQKPSWTDMTLINMVLEVVQNFS